MVHDNHCSERSESWVYKTPPDVRRRATITHLALSALIVLPALGVLAYVALSGFGAQRFWHALLVIGLGYAWVRHLQLYHTGGGTK